VGSNPIWDSEFLRVYILPGIYIISWSLVLPAFVLQSPLFPCNPFSWRTSLKK